MVQVIHNFKLPHNDILLPDTSGLSSATYLHVHMTTSGKLTHEQCLKCKQLLILCRPLEGVLFYSYNTALMQRRTCTTLFLDSTGLLERSTFLILEKIARVANDTQSRSFCEYRLLDRLRLAMANHIAMEATLPFYQTV